MLLQIVLDYYDRRSTRIQNRRPKKLIDVSEAYVILFGRPAIEARVGQRTSLSHCPGF